MNSRKPLNGALNNNFTVSVIIPAYNEERNIEDVLSRTNRIMEETRFPYEIIVVDDGSTDKTRLLAQRHKATILNYGANRGKGYALKQGIQKATGSVIVTLDADGSHQPEEIPQLLKPLLAGADIVVGSRFLGKLEDGSVKKLHILGNHIFNFLILLLTKKRITDSQTGFRALRKKVVQDIPITSEGYQIETELTIIGLKNGYAVQEKPITCARRKNGLSHLSPIRDGFRILRTILRTSLNTQEHPEP